MKVPVNTTVFSRCTGEFVQLTGEQTLGTHIETDGAGGLHTKFSIENRGLKGVGLSSGKKYVGFDTSENSAQLPQGATAISFELNLSLIRVGEDGGLLPGQDDWRVKDRFHVTFNALGVPTAAHSEFSDDCT